ncbi:MAG TPA: acylphosphatase [Longimicrobiales bacterium]|nr:acylphosphatase [Longimicrobiales bacterium]
MVRRRFRVSGVVQGVGFRFWTQRVGQSLALRGIVRNVEDGSVEVEVEGAPDQVDRLRRELERGPERALVTAVEELPSTDRQLAEPFGIAL